MNTADQTLLSTDVFFKDNFGIDEYLSKCTQKSELLTLRKNLKGFGVDLYTRMVDILKMETEDIINLAESLTNLNSKIDELSTPVSQLCEEIRVLYLAINNTKLHFEKHLNVVQSIRSDANRLNLKMGIISSSIHINNIINSWTEEDITILERAVNEYSFQYLYLNELDLQTVVIDNNDVSSTAKKLLLLVHRVFYKGIQNNKEETIIRCLRMYVNLGKQKDAEKCIKETIVRPALNLIFTQRNLDENAQDVKLLYSKAMEILNNELAVLLHVLDVNPDMKGFNFIVNSFWIEIDKQLCERLPNITAPGNPELFQKRFKETWNFLEQIKDVLKNSNLLQNDPSFQEHMKRFNVAVYFEIRFQQIAAKFEAAMLSDSIEYIQNKCTSFRLKMSSDLWSCVEQCFNEDVFLAPLSAQFLKFMMLLVARYSTWFDAHLVFKWKPYGDESIVDKLEKFVMSGLVDIHILKMLIGFSIENLHELDTTVLTVIPNEIRPPVIKILEVNKQIFNTIKLTLIKNLVEFKVKEGASHLQHVMAIPRLYRRTNRAIPREASGYINKVLASITKLHTDYDILAKSKIIYLMDVVITHISELYVSLIQEVLHSVCTIEESLRRLKNRNSNVNDDSASEINIEARSDEAKIREQIKLDVGYFVDGLQPYSLDRSKDILKRLINVSGYMDLAKDCYPMLPGR